MGGAERSLLDLPRLLRDLAGERPIFHSEADFQHALAWRIQLAIPEARIRLEVPAFGGSRDRVDIVVRLTAGLVPIELKYWQAAFSDEVDGEPFRLVNQSAQDMHRAAFAKDVMRVEQLVTAHGWPEGWVVALTNDASYWNAGVAGSTSDTAFRLHEGRELSGRLAWRTGTSPNTMKGTETVALAGRYMCRWSGYSRVGAARGEFRYLAIRVQ